MAKAQQNMVRPSVQPRPATQNMGGFAATAPTSPTGMTAPPSPPGAAPQDTSGGLAPPPTRAPGLPSPIPGSPPLGSTLTGGGLGGPIIPPGSTNNPVNPVNPIGGPTSTNPLPQPVPGAPTEHLGQPMDIGGTGGTFAIPGTGSREDTRRAIGQFANQTQQQVAQEIANLLAQQGSATSQQSSAFNPALAGFKEAQQTGGYDPAQLANLRSLLSGINTTGGYDPSQLSMLRNTYGNFTGTSGAFDPATLKSVLGGYQNFADTGGFSPTDQARFMRQATSGVPAVYDVLSQQAETNRSATGGLGTGGEISQMARQMAQEEAKAATGGEVALQQQISANKLAGLGGLETTGTEVGRERQSALTGLGTLEGDVAAGKRAGAGLTSGLEGSVAGGRLAGSTGLSNLYNTATGQVTALGNQILSALGMQFTNQRDALGLLTALADAQGGGPLAIMNAISNFITAGSGGAKTGSDIYSKTQTP